MCIFVFSSFLALWINRCCNVYFSGSLGMCVCVCATSCWCCACCCFIFFCIPSVIVLNSHSFVGRIIRRSRRGRLVVFVCSAAQTAIQRAVSPHFAAIQLSVGRSAARWFFWIYYSLWSQPTAANCNPSESQNIFCKKKKSTQKKTQKKNQQKIFSETKKAINCCGNEMKN